MPIKAWFRRFWHSGSKSHRPTTGTQLTRKPRSGPCPQGTQSSRSAHTHPWAAPRAAAGRKCEAASPRRRCTAASWCRRGRTTRCARCACAAGQTEQGSGGTFCFGRIAPPVILHPHWQRQGTRPAAHRTSRQRSTRRRGPHLELVQLVAGGCVPHARREVGRRGGGNHSGVVEHAGPHRALVPLEGADPVARLAVAQHGLAVLAGRRQEVAVGRDGAAPAGAGGGRRCGRWRAHSCWQATPLGWRSAAASQIPPAARQRLSSSPASPPVPAPPELQLHDRPGVPMAHQGRLHHLFRRHWAALGAGLVRAAAWERLQALYGSGRGSRRAAKVHGRQRSNRRCATGLHGAWARLQPSIPCISICHVLGIARSVSCTALQPLPRPTPLQAPSRVPQARSAAAAHAEGERSYDMHRSERLAATCRRHLAAAAATFAGRQCLFYSRPLCCPCSCRLSALDGAVQEPLPAV